jgi:hypothetical protein
MRRFAAAISRCAETYPSIGNPLQKAGWPLTFDSIIRETATASAQIDNSGQ